MKLTINYDLLRKIKEANTGICLYKTAKEILLDSAFMTGFATLFNISNSTPEVIKDKFLYYLLMSTIINCSLNLIFSKSHKMNAIDELRELSLDLTSINIPTNYDLLLESYIYETNYELEFNNNSFPRLKQNKYIMIPVQEDGEEKEVSIVQEHIIGSDEYTLSYGSPKKVLKLAKNSI